MYKPTSYSIDGNNLKSAVYSHPSEEWLRIESRAAGAFEGIAGIMFIVLVIAVITGILAFRLCANIVLIR